MVHRDILKNGIGEEKWSLSTFVLSIDEIVFAKSFVFYDPPAMNPEKKVPEER